MIKRFYQDLESFLRPGQVLLIYGPRRVGKTTLVETYLKKERKRYRLESGDNVRIQQVLSSGDFKQILGLVEGFDLLVIDEAQQIPNIGTGLKILVDQRPDMRLIATGSSSFELANQVGEPLTGRKQTLILYPVAQLELAQELNRYDLKEGLEDFLVYGSYPEVLTAKTKMRKQELLHELAESYVFKDIFTLEQVKGSHYLTDLLKLIAFQIGSEVSHQELARQLGLSVKTVQRYLDLFEKAFILVRVGGFSRNLRNEVARKSKYYFYDTGVRNAVISQFNDLSNRTDVGALWENFLFMERLKRRHYQKMYASAYFWRTYEGQEVDLVEEGEGGLRAFEFKWSDAIRKRIPSQWQDAYPNVPYTTITRENYMSFLLDS